MWNARERRRARDELAIARANVMTHGMGAQQDQTNPNYREPRPKADAAVYDPRSYREYMERLERDGYPSKPVPLTREQKRARERAKMRKHLDARREMLAAAARKTGRGRRKV